MHCRGVELHRFPAAAHGAHLHHRIGLLSMLTCNPSLPCDNQITRRGWKTQKTYNKRRVRGPMGPLTVVFPPGKKCSRLCREKIFPLHGRVRGPMGPPTFTQPGTQGPLLYPEGAHGAPNNKKKKYIAEKYKFTVGFPTKKNFTRACARESFLSKSVF